MSTQEDAVLQELIQRALAYPDGGISAEAEAEAAAEAAELAAEAEAEAVLSDSRRWPAGLRRLLDGPPPARREEDLGEHPLGIPITEPAMLRVAPGWRPPPYPRALACALTR